MLRRNEIYKAQGQRWTMYEMIVNSMLALLPWARAAGPCAVLPTYTGRNSKGNIHLAIDIYQIDI